MVAKLSIRQYVGFMQLSEGQSTSGDREQASVGSSDKAQGESTTNDASEHISLSLSLEGRADE
jgi:hypothetical protein